MILSFGLLIAECRELIKNLSNVSLFFVKRSLNRIAYYIARNRFLSDCNIHMNFPEDFYKLIEADLFDLFEILLR